MIGDIFNDIAGNFLSCLENLCVEMDSKKKVKSVTAAPLRYDNYAFSLIYKFVLS